MRTCTKHAVIGKARTGALVSAHATFETHGSESHSGGPYHVPADPRRRGPTVQKVERACETAHDFTCWRRSVRVPFPRADQRHAANSGWRHWRAIAGGSLIDKPPRSPAQGSWNGAEAFGEVQQAIYTPGVVIEHEQQGTRTVFRPRDQEQVIGAEVKHGKCAQKKSGIAPAPSERRCGVTRRTPPNRDIITARRLL